MPHSIAGYIPHCNASLKTPARAPSGYNRTVNIRERLLDAVRKSRLSERRLSQLATGANDTIRNIRRGALPRADTLEALCEVLGLEIQIAPGLTPPCDQTAAVPRPPTEFSTRRQLPTYRWTHPSEAGYQPHASHTAPAPVGLLDDHAFYVQMPDVSMVPAHIWKDDYCLISPAAQLQVDQRGWFRRAAGRETIRWVMRLPSGGYDLAAWDLDQEEAVGHQKPSAVHWRREDVIDRGVVVAVYRRKPTTEKPQEPVRDWRPDALAELSRAALFSEQFRKVEAEIDRAVAAVEQMEMHIKRRVAEGSLSPFQAEQILRVLDYRLQHSLRSIREALTTVLPGAS